MTNEELAVQIQKGTVKRLHELWAQVERLARYWSNQYARILVDNGIAYDVRDTFNDLFNGCGYPAMCKAAERFEPEKGSFAKMFYYCFRTEAAELYGYRSTKRDAMMAAKSLNEPLGDGTEDLELEDMVPDPNDHYEDAERLMMLEQLHDTLDAALDELPSFSGEVLRQRYYNSMTQTEIAERTGKRHSYIFDVERKAYRQIKRGRYAQKLYQFLYPGEEYRSRGLRGTGLSAFMRTGASATENAALQIIEQKEKSMEEWRKDGM